MVRASVLCRKGTLVRAAALFVTYDGLLDPLGGSQILPYLYGVAAHPRPLHILSFEKTARFDEGADRLRSELQRRGIGWTPLTFTTRAGKLGKLWDLARMYCTALLLQRKHHFQLIHCRSYQAMQVGRLLHGLTGARTLFDMRGLWVDERVDGGLWNRDRWLDRIAYAAYKGIERRLLASASHVIALTRRVVPELQRISPDMSAPVSVIPCCADFDHFQVVQPRDRLETRTRLGVPDDARLLTYLGSLGTWYMLEEMLRFFAAAHEQWGNMHLLVVTQDWRSEHEELVQRLGMTAIRDRIHVKAATRQEVPKLIGSSDAMLSFIKSAYSKMASSPTKLAEAFAMGVPVISNTGVGDVDALTHELDAGVVFNLNDPVATRDVINNQEAVYSRGGSALRSRARGALGLEVAHKAYRDVYDRLERNL